MSMDNNDLWAAALKTLSEEDRKLVAFDGQHKLDVLSDLGQLVDNAKENSIKKRWRFHRPGGGQTVILRDLFSKIVVWIDRFKEVGDIVVQYDPVHAALPWAGVRFLLQLAVSDINKFAFIVEGVETIARSISRYATFEHIYLGYDSTATRAIEELIKALVKLYAAILIYLGKAKYYFEERTPKRMAKSMVTSQSIYEALLRNIDSELANVDRHAGLVDAEHSNDISNTLSLLSMDQREMHKKLRELLRSIDSPICRMSRQLDSLEDELKDSQRVEILRWLSPQPYMDHHQQIKKQALRGSGQWLLRDPFYVQWYEQSVSSLLWLRGKPGSGKSTLVSLVIEDMIERFEAGQSALPVYFYCIRSAAEPERSDPHAVLASILRQLSCVQPGKPILSPVIEKYKRQGEGFKSNGLDLDDSRDLIIRLIEDYSMTIIVVDALDECDPLKRQSLLDAFEQILKESVGLVKIFVSSRNDQDIVYTLRNYPNTEISSDKNTADIKRYVETETMRLVKTGQLLRNSRAKETMMASIIEQVSGGADGMFRWASLQLDVLRALKRDEDIRARLGKLPPKLEQLYVDVYNNLISAQGEIGRSIIDNALKWLLCARKELCAADFLTAVAANLNISDEDISVDSLLELCNNFVVYDDGLDVFRFAHLSVREFLEHMPEFTKVPCCSLAAECCLMQMIASSNCPNTEDLMTDVHLHRLRGSPTSAETPSSARFLEYANDLWIEYCQSIPLNDRSQDTNFGRAFYFFLSDKLGSSSPLNTWVQWYCSRVRDTDSAASLELQDLLTICSHSLPRLFFVAIFSGFIEIATSCLRDRLLSNEMKERGLLLAAMAAQHEIFALLSEGIGNWVMTGPLLIHAACAFDKEVLRWLLDKAPDAMITHRTFFALAKDWDDGKIAMFFDRYPDLSITEGMLEVAVEKASLDNFGRLVARAVNPVITEHMLLISLYQRLKIKKPLAAYTEKIFTLLERMGGSDFTPGLMGFAARHSDEQIIEAMLKKGGIITEDLMVDAVRRGREMLQLMLQYGGKVTDTVLDEAMSGCNVQTWQMLLEQGYASGINVKRLKLAALNYNHGDALLSILLDHADLTALTNELAGLIREVARRGGNDPMRQLLNRAKDVMISQDMLLAACFNQSFDRLGRVQMFLERSSELQITEDMLVIAADDGHQGIELMQVFLERGGEADISEYVLMAAAFNQSQGYQIMRLLLEQDRVAAITEDVLICAAQYSSPDLVLSILERTEAKVFGGGLLEAAAANEAHGGDLVKLLLPRAGTTGFPEDVFGVALGNEGNGIEVVTVLEEIFGQINVTENLMARCIHRATSGTIGLLLSRTDPAQITKEILIRAMSDPAIETPVQHFVAEKSLHVPITIEILVPAAQYGSPNLFRFLWHRYRRSSVPEELINAAAKNYYAYDPSTLEFLLHETDCIEIGEQTLMNIAASGNACTFFDLLLERGLRADTTEGVPKTLLMNGGIKTKCSFSSPLQLSRCTKVTETMFKIAASRGDEEFLEKLTEFCGLGSTPEIWLDIARLFNAAKSDDKNLLKTLLERGVEPDVAGPHGETPLVMAAWWDNTEVVQILLSAGASPDGGPNLERSPLCWAADRGRYDMVKMLVNAGASLDIKDDKGQTPSMIAKSNRHILVFRYLEQSRMQQERAGRQTLEST